MPAKSLPTALSGKAISIQPGRVITSMLYTYEELVAGQ
jgi:hypothetical protein